MANSGKKPSRKTAPSHPSGKGNSNKGKGGSKTAKRRSSGDDDAPPARVFFIGVTVILGGLLMLNMMKAIPDAGTEISNSVPENVSRRPLTDAQARGLAPLIAAEWRGEEEGTVDVPRSLRSGDAVAFIEARATGLRLGRPVWREGNNAIEALRKALSAARKSLNASDLERADALVVGLAHSFESIDPKDDRGKITNVRRGLRGLEFIHQNRVTRVSPTEMIANNRDFKKTIERFEADSGLGKGAIGAGRARVRIFEMDQMLVLLNKDPLVVEPMFRGNQLIPIEDVTKASTQHLSDTLSSYLFTNLQPDGRQVYIWWPSRGDEATNNNMIRQWMATVAMGRVARKNDDDPSNDDPEQLARVAKNIDYNLSKFYHEEPHPDGGEPLGLIEWRGKVKLGAIALTALAIAEHPDRARWERHEKAIQRTMDYQWRDDGYFKSFYKPKDYRDFHNFYPGEALLYWSTLLKKDGIDTLAVDGQTKLLDKFMKSVWYFKEWHLNNRNPAFIPWHTQAYYNLYQLTRDDKVRDWVFEMNDWLLGVQQWDDRNRFPDTNGRFYHTSNKFGPPHASSTGVYLEGLIFAWLLAKDAGQTERQERYRQAIVRGLRSCMQLTFFDEIDMYYVSKRDRVLGGVRETVYDNEIRVDNVQHNLMGILNILRFMEPTEFRP